MTRSVAIDFDAVLGDTRPLWHAWVVDAERRYRVGLGGAVDEAMLDERLGNWRVLVERFAEEHAPVYLRPHPDANAALRRLQAAGVRLGAFTDSPEPLARVAAAQLGVGRHLETLEAGRGALDRLLGRLGPMASVVRTVEELEAAAGRTG
jgi:phosphoglycolate phosphatase-like HAD superfamily hydrolase